jgi:sarcosine oxidase delta subunit
MITCPWCGADRKMIDNCRICGRSMDQALNDFDQWKQWHIENNTGVYKTYLKKKEAHQ